MSLTEFHTSWIVQLHHLFFVSGKLTPSGVVKVSVLIKWVLVSICNGPTMSFRMTAVMATWGSFPAALSWSYFALRSRLKR